MAANGQITIENARLAFRNFSGKEGQYNAKGNRNFCVLLNNETAEKLKEDGWNIRYLRPREEEDEPQAYLQVAVNYGSIPPKIVLITSNGKTVLGEEEIGTLDWAEIQESDLIIRPYNWEVNGKTGVKAYLKSLYVTIVEDDLERKYLDVPESAKTAIGAEENGD